MASRNRTWRLLREILLSLGSMTAMFKPSLQRWREFSKYPDQRFQRPRRLDSAPIIKVPHSAYLRDLRSIDTEKPECDLGHLQSSAPAGGGMRGHSWRGGG